MNAKSEEAFEDPKYNQPHNAHPKPERKPAAGHSPPKPGKEGTHPAPHKPGHEGSHNPPHKPGHEGHHPPPHKPGHEGHHPPTNEGKAGFPNVTGNSKTNHGIASGGVCAPCKEVDCSNYEKGTDADICCPIIEPSPAPKKLRVLVVVLIIVAIVVFCSLVSLMVYFYIKYLRMRREMDNLRLYHEQQEHQYQGPSLAPAQAREYQPGEAVVRVQPTQQ